VGGRRPQRTHRQLSEDGDPPRSGTLSGRVERSGWASPAADPFPRRRAETAPKGGLSGAAGSRTRVPRPLGRDSPSAVRDQVSASIGSRTAAIDAQSEKDVPSFVSDDLRRVILLGDAGSQERRQPLGRRPSLRDGDRAIKQRQLWFFPEDLTRSHRESSARFSYLGRSRSIPVQPHDRTPLVERACQSSSSLNPPTLCSVPHQAIQAMFEPRTPWG
jgi:hypothetical protein